MIGYSSEDALSSFECSEDEYVPDSESSAEDNSSEDVRLHLGEKKSVQKTPSTNSEEVNVRPHKRGCITSSSSLSTNERGESSPDGLVVAVMTLNKKEDGGRLYSKNFYCVFCCKPFRKMAQHLEAKHKDKPELAWAVAFPKGSKERRLSLGLLSNRRNRAHNNQVIKEGKRMVIPHQQSKTPVKASDYMHCINCEAYLRRKSLWRHMTHITWTRKWKA